MSLFDAPDPRKVELQGTTQQVAPQYLTDYLTQLAQTGQGQLGQSQIAGLPQNLQDLYSGAQGTLNRYQPAMNQSLQTLQGAAQGITGADISQFYDPYQQDVVDEMGRQSNLNTQRNLLPALKAAFVGGGNLGSSRYANATGQALSDVESNLLGQQSKFRSEGYKNAMDAALRDRGYDIQAGQGLYGLGQAESQAGVQNLKTLGDIGTQELGYEQSRIEAPLTRAQNVAKLLQGYQFPMTVNKTEEQIPGAFAPSPLQQIAGLGSLVNAGIKGGAGDSLSNFLKGINWSGSTGDLRGGSLFVTGGENLGYSEAGGAAGSDDNPFPIL
jgi:hypothetical protein